MSNPTERSILDALSQPPDFREIRLDDCGPSTILSVYFEYDACGNMARAYNESGYDYRYGWDGLGRLSAVELNGAAVVYYYYDALGRRVMKNFPEGSSGSVPKVGGKSLRSEWGAL